MITERVYIEGFVLLTILAGHAIGLTSARRIPIDRNTETHSLLSVTHPRLHVRERALCTCRCLTYFEVHAAAIKQGFLMKHDLTLAGRQLAVRD